MSQPARRRTGSELAEITLGIVLALGALAWWSVPAAAFTAGVAIIADSLLSRRRVA